MTLIGRLTDHRGEVGSILYRPRSTTESTSRKNSLNEQGEWISGSDDCTIKVWVRNYL